MPRLTPLVFLLVVALTTACNDNRASEKNVLQLWPLTGQTELVFYNDSGEASFSGQAGQLGEKFTLALDDDDNLYVQIRDNPWAGIQFKRAEPVDLSPYLKQGVVTLEVNVKASTELSMEVQLGCGPDCLRRRELHKAFISYEGQGWQNLRIPLSCFVREGDSFSKVQQPLALAIGGSGELSIRSARLAQTGEPNIHCTDYQTLAVTPQVLNPHWARSWWLPRHKEKKAIAAQGNIDLVFLGDSITQGWEKEGREIWQQHFAPLNALNLGFAGDRTENVLWRLEQGAVDDIHPKLLVLMIGTNNTGHRQDSAEATASGIKAILNEINNRLPDTRVLLLGIFPRGAEADDPLRQLNARINNIIETYADGEQVLYRNINDIFLDEKGRLSETIMPDHLHPNEAGYRLWADAMEKEIDQLMQ